MTKAIASARRNMNSIGSSSFSRAFAKSLTFRARRCVRRLADMAATGRAGFGECATWTSILRWFSTRALALSAFHDFSFLFPVSFIIPDSAFEAVTAKTARFSSDSGVPWLTSINSPGHPDRNHKADSDFCQEAASSLIKKSDHTTRYCGRRGFAVLRCERTAGRAVRLRPGSLPSHSAAQWVSGIGAVRRYDEPDIISVGGSRVSLRA